MGTQDDHSPPWVAPIRYNQLLPYYHAAGLRPTTDPAERARAEAHCRGGLEAEADTLLASLLEAFQRAVLSRDLTPTGQLAVATRRMSDYIDLYGFRFTVEQLLALIETTYSLITTTKNIQLSSQAGLMTFLTRLLEPTAMLPVGLIVLDWRPLAAFYRYLHCHPRFPFKLEAKEHLTPLCTLMQACRDFFAPSAAQELLDEYLPMLVPVDSSFDEASQMLSLLLPTRQVVEKHMIQAQLAAPSTPIPILKPEQAVPWFSPLMQTWRWTEDRKPWDCRFLELFSRLAQHSCGLLDWSEVSDRFFTAIARQLEIPSGAGFLPSARGGKLRGEQVDTSRWIVGAMRPDGAILDRLESLLQSIETYYHPSNNGAWSDGLSVFLHRLADTFSSRYAQERQDQELLAELQMLRTQQEHGDPRAADGANYGVGDFGFERPSTSSIDKSASRTEGATQPNVFSDEEHKLLAQWCPIPESERITPETVRRFVEMLRPLALLQLFAKSETFIANAVSTIKILALLCPQAILPQTLERIYPALETVTETHQTSAALACLAGLSRLLFWRRFYPGGAQHLPALLQLILPGIDVNDWKKTTPTLHFLSCLFANVPIRNYSLLARNEAYGRAFGHDNYLSLPFTDVDEQLCEASASFGDWVLQLIDKVLDICENQLPPSKRGDIGEGALWVLPGTCELLFLSLEPEWLDNVILRVFDFTMTHLRMNSLKLVGRLCKSLCAAAPAKVLRQFVPRLCEQIIANLEVETPPSSSPVTTTPDGANQATVGDIQRVDDQVLWQLRILAQIVDSGAAKVLEYKPMLLQTLQVCFSQIHLFDRRLAKAAGKLLRRLLRTLTLPNSRSHKQFDLQDPSATRPHLQQLRDLYDNWGHAPALSKVSLNWDTPTAEGLALVDELLTTILAPTMARLDKLLLGVRESTLPSFFAKHEALAHLNVLYNTIAGAGSYLGPYFGTAQEDQQLANQHGHPWIPRPPIATTTATASQHCPSQDWRSLLADCLASSLSYVVSAGSDDTKAARLLIKCSSRFISDFGRSTDYLKHSLVSVKGAHKALSAVRFEGNDVSCQSTAAWERLTVRFLPHVSSSATPDQIRQARIQAANHVLRLQATYETRARPIPAIISLRRVLVMHCSRVAALRYSGLFTKRMETIAAFLLQLAIHPYLVVRKRSQHAMRRVMETFPTSSMVLLPKFLSVLEEATAVVAAAPVGSRDTGSSLAAAAAASLSSPSISIDTAIEHIKGILFLLMQPLCLVHLYSSFCLMERCFLAIYRCRVIERQSVQAMVPLLFNAVSHPSAGPVLATTVSDVALTLAQQAAFSAIAAPLDVAALLAQGQADEAARNDGRRAELEHFSQKLVLLLPRLSTLHHAAAEDAGEAAPTAVTWPYEAMVLATIGQVSRPDALLDPRLVAAEAGALLSHVPMIRVGALSIVVSIFRGLKRFTSQPFVKSVQLTTPTGGAELLLAPQPMGNNLQQHPPARDHIVFEQANPPRNTSHTAPPGERLDNQDRRIQVHNPFPRTREEWEATLFAEKNFLGWVAFPRSFVAYRYTKDLPGLGIRDPASIQPAEAPLWAAFADPVTAHAFVKQFILFQEMDHAPANNDAQSSGARFSTSTAKLYKRIFRQLGPAALEPFKAHLMRQVKSDEPGLQRTAAEIIAGAVRGSKHWTFDCQEQLWLFIVPLLRTAFDKAGNYTIDDWNNCLLFAVYDRDVHRLRHLVQLVLREPLFSNDTSSFYSTYRRLLFAHAVSSEMGWRVADESLLMMPVLLENLSYPYKLVRQQLALLILGLLQGTTTPQTDGAAMHFHPAASQALPAIVTALERWHAFSRRQAHESTESSPSSGSSSDPSPSVTPTPDRSETSLLSPEDEACLNAGRTALEFVLRAVTRLGRFVLDEHIHSILPLLFQSYNSTDEEVRIVGRQALNEISNLVFQPVVLERLLRAMIAPLDRASQHHYTWHAKIAFLFSLQSLVFRNQFYISREMLDMILQAVLQLMKDEQIEVRQLAGETLGVLTRCDSRITSMGLIETTFLPWSRTQLPSRTLASSQLNSKQREQVLQRHAGVIGLCAFVQAQPYTLPSWMPELLVEIGSHLSDRGAIQATVKKTLSEFWRTHQDNWHNFKLQFTEDQLSVITDLLISPNYYA
ncbi:proteasome activator subunit 4 [Capsaspora owczarzaki ATCC 30864]|uniref:Proteasome activator subunit 4, variant n=1 Tax=Capsaspora owczarzaki (strain ATCC 30864) TaxID=595528 RepID=A0A0D2X5J1_CAPO3|nr:proteasome activator subunit 4 [Capsaspora owczarzaki ATCC 30864]KJE97899.1 proteasome activator subunit 4, variant [Capsaspora owczarzaki ATCC 30864]|eukprot:XP_004343064.1 proteasome activator subunit 4 [Capsaspora owczarzaki ATCC 30864]